MLFPETHGVSKASLDQLVGSPTKKGVDGGELVRTASTKERGKASSKRKDSAKSAARTKDSSKRNEPVSPTVSDHETATSPPNTAEKKKRRVGELRGSVRPRPQELVLIETSGAVDTSSEADFNTRMRNYHLATQTEIKVTFSYFLFLCLA